VTDLDLYEKLRGEARACALCNLCTTRNEVVVDRGNPDARLVFIGEAPGEKEDLEGRAFIGPAGEELDKLIAKAGIGRDEFLIINVLKCRPLNNRFPGDAGSKFKPEETVAKCLPYLDRQLELVNPKAVIIVGRKAAAWTLYRGQEAPSMGALAGRWIRSDRYMYAEFFAMYHTAYLLRLRQDDTARAVEVEEQTLQVLRWANDVTLSGRLPDAKPILLRSPEKRAEQGNLF